MYIDDIKIPHIARVLKALGHPVRLKLIQLLIGQPATVNSLVQALEMEQAVVSQHLRILRESGLLEVSRRGNQRIYKSANPNLRTLLQCLSGCQKGEPKE